MRVDAKVTPGRYALDGDGTWHLFTDRAALAFKPVAVVTVKAPEPPIIAVDMGVKPAVVAVPARKARRAAATPKPVPAAFQPAFAKHDRMIVAKRAADGGSTRTATPGDVFRAIGEQFGILPAMGARVSAARFKPMGKRDADADAARDYERSVRDRQSRD